MADRQPIPNENLLEVLSYLDRGELEGVQLTSALFKTIVAKNADNLCLRPIHEVRLLPVQRFQVKVANRFRWYGLYRTVLPVRSTVRAGYAVRYGCGRPVLNTVRLRFSL